MNPISSLAISADNLSIISGDEKGNLFVCDSERYIFFILIPPKNVILFFHLVGLKYHN